MYKTLVDHLEKVSVRFDPELAQYSDLRAVITHWLHNPYIDFRCRSEEIVALWESEVENFLESKGLKNLNEIDRAPFYQGHGDFQFIDLFAGIGGFRLALQAVGGECVFSSEWDKAAQETYFRNYGEYPYGDINNFTDDNISDEEIDRYIPDHRILAGGFPCQPFSHAGVSARTALGLAHGFECTTQGTLFHSIARIAAVKQPEIVFMENVRNIVSHNKGETFQIIKDTMENLSGGVEGRQNYHFYYQLVNSETVVPQRRVRCFMVCVREDIHEALGKYEFPGFDGKSIPLRQALVNLTNREIEEYTISDKLWEGHINRTQRNLARGTGFTAHLADLDRPSNTIVARYGKDGKECLIPQEGMNPRKLTIKECANLFGYPEGFLTPSSKTPAYKQFGNSVVVPVVQEIAGSVVDYLNQPRQHMQLEIQM